MLTIVAGLWRLSECSWVIAEYPSMRAYSHADKHSNIQPNALLVAPNKFKPIALLTTIPGLLNYVL